MSMERIEALERMVAQLAEHVGTQAAATVAQAVVCRAVADLLVRGFCSLDDVRDHAFLIADAMGEEVRTALRSLLSEPTASAGQLQ